MPAGVHVAAPADENVPAAHGVADPAPDEENVPAGSVVHVAAPAGENVPATHGVSSFAPAAATYEPASASAHGVYPDAEYDPGEQSVTA